MAETESLSKTLQDTVTLSRELREDGQIDGQVKLYNVDDDEEFESDADLFFDRTLMTQGLREALSILRDSLTGDDPRGTHILYGPYGSGKSHQMVAMYHCFADPDAAGEFGDRHVDVSHVGDGVREGRRQPPGSRWLVSHVIDVLPAVPAHGLGGRRLASHRILLTRYTPVSDKYSPLYRNIGQKLFLTEYQMAHEESATLLER